MGIRGWMTAGVLSFAAATALYAEEGRGAPDGPRVVGPRKDAVPYNPVPGNAVPGNALPGALKVNVIDLGTGRESSLEEHVRRIRQRKAEEWPSIEQIGEIYRKMLGEKPIKQRQAEGRRMLDDLDMLIATMPICDDDVLARQMLDFKKAGDLYLSLEQYPKAVRAYMEAVKRSYRNEAEALRQSDEAKASAYELERVQALRGMSMAWYAEGKREEKSSGNTTYSHALYGRALDARSSAHHMLVARKKDGRSSGTDKESIVDDLMRLGSLAVASGDDRSVAAYARRAVDEMVREQREKQLRREASLVRIYADALKGVKSGQDMIDTLNRLDRFIYDPQQ